MKEIGKLLVLLSREEYDEMKRSSSAVKKADDGKYHLHGDTVFDSTVVIHGNLEISGSSVTVNGNLEETPITTWRASTPGYAMVTKVRKI